VDCPVCKEAMVVLELDEVEIDHCLECGGIWLDQGELELLLESSEEKDKLLASFKEDKESGEELLKCPICLKKMKKILSNGEKKILIDSCKNNDGLWFDKGELYQMIESVSLDKNNRILNLLREIFREHK